MVKYYGYTIRGLRQAQGALKAWTKNIPGNYRVVYNLDTHLISIHREAPQQRFSSRQIIVAVTRIVRSTMWLKSKVTEALDSIVDVDAYGREV